VDTDEKRELEGGLRRCMGREEGFGAETFFKVCQVFERSEGNRDPFLAKGLSKRDAGIGYVVAEGQQSEREPRRAA